MADIKISQLPSLSTMTDAAQVPVVAAGTTQQITGANLKTYFGNVASIANGNSSVGIAASNGNATVTTAGTYTWTFGTTGNLSAPGEISAPSLTTNSIRSDDSSFVNIEDGVNVTGAIDASGNIAGNYFIGNGSQLTGISAGANIGNVTFSDQIVVGTGTNDGTGGLYLAPGTNSTANLQYLRVRGGDVATHIHLDTGNNAYFDQYFGDDGKYVKLANTGNVLIGSDNGIGNSAQWTFGTDGRLINLEGLTLTAGGQFNICTVQTGGSGYDTGSALKATTGGSGTGMTVGIGYGLSNQLTNVDVVDPGTGYVDGDVITVSGGTGGTFVITKYNEQANQANNNFIESDWAFGTDGSLTLPIGVSIDYNGNVQYPKIIADSGKLFSVQGQGNTGSAALAWTVNPNAASQYAAVSVSRGGGDSLAKVVLQAQSDSGNAATAKTWKFDETGTLTVPAANGVPGRISTQTTLASEKGFDLRITAGNTDGCTVPGGDMYLSAGVGYNGISHGAGNVNIVTGDRYGNVTGNIWRFDSSGTLTLPLGNATIKNTAGNALAFGLNAGLTSQGANAVAIGINSGVYSQSASAVAIGALAGNGGRVSTNYVSGAVSPSTTLVVTSTTGIVPGMIITGTGFFGNITVVTVTNSTTLEISASAVFTPSGALTFTGSQGDNSIAIGTQAGQVQQGQFAVAIGDNAGNSGQGTDAVAIGASAGLNTQGAGAVAFGQGTGETSQGANAVAIGKAAGQVSQGINSVAIGQSAGLTNQGNNSIILNATGSALEQTTANTFTVAPVRNDVSNIGNVMFYNTTSKEITYGNTISVAGNITGNYFIGNGSQLTGINNSFAGEMHVSKDGNDSTGTGNILQPYLTITHALTQVGGGRNTVVIHPGTYTENPTITSQATQLITYDATGASTLVNGTVTIANVTGRIAGLKMTNLAITGNAQAYINSSTVDGQFTKSSSGYVEVDDCELQVSGNVLISGSGTISIVGNKINNLVVNNAGAAVLVKGADDCVMPQVTAGSLNIVDSVIRASSNTANAVTASAGTVVTLMNNQIVTPAADNVARVSIAGYHSIISLVYDKANSTLSNSLNSVVYFQTANVDSLVSSGNVTGGNITTAGLITATGNISGGNLTVGSGTITGGNVNGANFNGNVAFGAGTVGGSGNITGGNLSAIGNITGNYFIGNGSLLTGISGGGSYSNANVSAFLAAYGSNTITTTGNITSGSLRAGTGNSIATIDQASGNLRISAGFTTTAVPPTAYVLSSGTDYTSGDLIVGVGGNLKVLRATVSGGWSANANTAFSLLTTSASNVRVNSEGIGYSAYTALTSVNYFAGNTSYILVFGSDVTFLTDWNVGAIDMTVSGSTNSNDNVVVYTGGVASAPVLSINGVTKDIQAYGALNMGGKIIANAASITATGNISGNNILASTRVITTPVARSTLAATPGGRAFVNDGNVSAFSGWGTSVGGGGSNIVPVWSDGSGWYIG